MPRITVSTTIEAAPDRVWAAIEDIGSHTEWMVDAEEIRFTSPRTSGVGTTFECDTAVGPFRLTDEMEVTAWEPGRRMGVRHVGLVTGDGSFTLSPTAGGGTRFRWQEQLTFPRWMGGPVGALVGARVLQRIWRRNLRRLRTLVEDPTR